MWKHSVTGASEEQALSEGSGRAILRRKGLEGQSTLTQATKSPLSVDAVQIIMTNTKS